ncbi:ATP-binding protein [Breoghania sp.]|uniref:sensor histidine kinase n=1 Tax=Breoghania sp. TaxID=2065378 RepID=UPI00262427C2|nr:ATP-binding protein [Breoghania sp.]MDJ0931004.1 ATP-binding protein [Breoghania sp.]
MSPFSRSSGRIVWRRIALVVFLIAQASWLVMVITAYLDDLGTKATYPITPDRLAAIIRSVEETPDAKHLLSALDSANLEVATRNKADGPVTPQEQVVRRQDDNLRACYLTVVGDRPLDIFPFERPFQQTDILHTPWRKQLGIEFHIGLRDGRVLIIRSLAPDAFGVMGIPIGMAAGLMAAIISLIVVIAMYREILSLAKLSKAIDHMDLSSDRVPLPDVRHKSPELRSLVNAFDRLQTRLSEVLKSRFVLIAGISHDLRTFATRLRLRIHSIPDEHQRMQSARDIEDMIALLDNALLATRVETDNASEELLDLADLIRSEVKDRQVSGQPVSFEGPVGDEVLVIGSRLGLRRIVNNLIENAVRYGERANVSLETDEHMARVRVTDNGPGISPDMAEAVMEPFVRGELSRNRNTGGAGLGLTIARNLVEARRAAPSTSKRPTRENRSSAFLSRSLSPIRLHPQSSGVTIATASKGLPMRGAIGEIG